MGPVKVELLKQETKYQLTVDDKPFYIKGAGLEWGSIQSLAEHGGNAFRTWRVDNGENTGLQILDEAHKYGLMVCMGIDVAENATVLTMMTQQPLPSKKRLLSKIF